MKGQGSISTHCRKDQGKFQLYVRKKIIHRERVSALKDVEQKVLRISTLGDIQS